MDTKRFLQTLFLVLTLSTQPTYPHSGKARHHIIIDTDCAADDLRTICMLLGNRQVEVLAITTSEGGLLPSMGARRVASLLKEFYHDGIDVGTGRIIGATPPTWRSTSEQVIWSSREVPAKSQLATDVILNAIDNEQEEVTIVALGALTNIADALQAKPSVKRHIARIIWYNDISNPIGSNHITDPHSARKVMQSQIPLIIVSSDRDTMPLQKSLLDSIANIKTPYAEKITASHSRPPLRELTHTGHLKCWDDLVAVALFAPQLFSVEIMNPSIEIWRLCNENFRQAEQTIIDILRVNPDGENRVFAHFPTYDSLYADDVQPIIEEAIRRHGHSEWRATVLTNELHGHLGIYATIGVKMGLRAREYFNIGVDDIAILSSAGSTPPISCLNDGLQVATGATVGHGLIDIAPTKKPIPAARFQFRGKTINISLRPEYIERISRDVKQAIAQHGNLTEAYWQAIRALAIGYWAELDRHEIFIIEEL